MSDRRWSIIVHGGARTIAADRQPANRKGCLHAAKIGAEILRGGGSAIDAAEQAVRQLEDDLTFNAGSGSVPTAAGKVEMDAAMMDGATLNVGAVGVLSDIRHPVSVARLLLEEPSVLLVGEGACTFAAQAGMPAFTVPPAADVGPDHDTVGCVAFDSAGHIAVATSTGGLPGQRPGRIGDAPIPGCGFYADDQAGGVAISGDGESILRVHLAARVIADLGQSSAGVAMANALEQLGRVGGEAGIISLDRNGHFGIAHNSDHFAVALSASWLPDALAGVHHSEFEGHFLDD